MSPQQRLTTRFSRRTLPHDTWCTCIMKWRTCTTCPFGYDGRLQPHVRRRGATYRVIPHDTRFPNAMDFTTPGTTSKGFRTTTKPSWWNLRCTRTKPVERFGPPHEQRNVATGLVETEPARRHGPK